MRILERIAAILGTMIFTLLFVVSCFAPRFTLRDSIVLCAIAIGFSIAWLFLRRPLPENSN